MTGRQFTAFDGAVAKRLRDLRQERRLTQKEIANRIGIAYQQYQKYEKGKDRIFPGRLKEIATALDLNVLQFLAPLENAAGDIEAPPQLTRRQKTMLKLSETLTTQKQDHVIAAMRFLQRDPS